MLGHVGVREQDALALVDRRFGRQVAVRRPGGDLLIGPGDRREGAGKEHDRQRDQVLRLAWHPTEPYHTVRFLIASRLLGFRGREGIRRWATFLALVVAVAACPAGIASGADAAVCD